jgi:hypothetical protein
MVKEDDDATSVTEAMFDHHQESSPYCENAVLGLTSIVMEKILEPFVLLPHEPNGKVRGW